MCKKRLKKSQKEIKSDNDNLHNNQFISKNIKYKPNVKIIKKKRKNFSLKSIYPLYPSITHFNLYSFFIYDNNEYENFFKTVSNKNLIKVNSDEYDFLQFKVNEIYSFRNYNRNIQYVRLSKENYNRVEKFLMVNKAKDPIQDYIQNKIDNSADRRDLSCRKLAEKYKEETGNTVSKSKINQIIKYKMGYSYLKSTVKTNKIIGKENILISFAFIKIISRCLKLGYKIIYLDETGLMNGNNNYRCLRKNNEQIYFNTGTRDKRNLILAIDEKQVIYYEITKENTTEEVFLNFMKKLKEKLDMIIYPKFVVCMDNHSSHKTPNMMNFYKDNKINIVFNAPYLSIFNSVELTFRYIKRFLYMSLFSDINELCLKVESLLEDIKFNNTLLYNFGETIEEYIRFINKFKDINLNKD